MCDCFGGSVILAIHRSDPDALGAFDQTFGSQRVDRLEDWAPDRAVDVVRSLPHSYFQVTVPLGGEAFYADRFRTAYVERLVARGASSDEIGRFLLDEARRPIVQAEGLATTSAMQSPSAGAGFSFTPEHNVYRSVIGMQVVSGQVHSPQVGILDSGWTSPPALSVNVVSTADFTVKGGGTAVPDVYGHGSVVLGIIHDLVPGAQFRVYRLSTGSDVREWTFLAGLAAAASECDVLNASVGFGLADRTCNQCRRDWGTTRSQVFHRFLESLLDIHPNLVYIGAAGNQSMDRPCYPARFSQAVCVGSINGNGDLSSFSNWGNFDQDDQRHPCFLLAPGGDRSVGAQGTDAYVASYLNLAWRGTSFAAAYVTGLVADYLHASVRLPGDRSSRRSPRLRTPGQSRTTTLQIMGWA